jgi:arginase family enzyme
VTVLRVPYHLDEYLPDLDLPLDPARVGAARTITADIPPGDPWIVWFDAHGDVQTPETTASGYLAGAAIGRAGVADLDPAAMPDGPLYVHLDLDVIDPAFLPGLQNPTPGGAARIAPDLTDVLVNL